MHHAGRDGLMLMQSPATSSPHLPGTPVNSGQAGDGSAFASLAIFHSLTNAGIAPACSRKQR